MNKNLANVFWGIILIAGGAYALVQTTGYDLLQSPTLWAFIFGGISILSLIFYFTDGVKSWSWLFPVGIFAALSFLMAMVANNVDNPAMVAPLFIGIGLPFVVAYVLDREKNWWALIPMGVMSFLTLVMLAVDNVGGEWIGSGFLFIIALTFFLIYLNRRALWAAITSYALFALGLIPLMAMTSKAEFSGVVVFLAIGLPFLYVYFTNPARWWAIIPAGVMLTMGLVTAIILLSGIPGPEYDSRVANAIIFAGLAATFAVVWFRHQKRWSMFAAIISAVIGFTGFFIRNIDNYLPVLMMSIGVYLLYNALRPKTTN